MAGASNEVSGHMESHILSASNPLWPSVLSKSLKLVYWMEISNFSGAIRHHIYWHGKRNEADNTLRIPTLFFIYQTTCHGPQNGFRLCLVPKRFQITSATKSESDVEDDIDRLEQEISQGHMEVILLGSKPTASDKCKVLDLTQPKTIIRESWACGSTQSAEGVSECKLHC